MSEPARFAYEKVSVSFQLLEGILNALLKAETVLNNIPNMIPVIIHFSSFRKEAIV